MADSLRGKIFSFHQLSGVSAIAPMHVIDNRRKLTEIEHSLAYRHNVANQQIVLRGLTHLKKYPIFTFRDDFKDAPWLTGGPDLFKALLHYIKAEGGTVWNTSFYVPFSSRKEDGFHGPEAAKREMRFVTSAEQFEEEFGISLREFYKDMHSGAYAEAA